MTRPTITIAIPSYNKENYIEECIKSALLNKKYVDKIIVVDNKSEDKTLEIAKKYENEIVCYQNELNLGMSGNFNRCIELCDTDWLMILHADDELVEGSIKKYLDMMVEFESLGLISADSYSMKEKDRASIVYNPKNEKKFWKKGVEAMTCPHGVCSTVMVKMDAYKKYGGFIESSLSSDVEMWARVASNYDVGLINEPTVIYRNNTTSTGPQSLINRSIAEIKADWDLLEQKIYESIPGEKAKAEYLIKTQKDAPYNYYAVLTANIRSRNYSNIYQALMLIIFKQKGLFVLIKLIAKTVKNKIFIKK